MTAGVPTPRVDSAHGSKAAEPDDAVGAHFLFPHLALILRPMQVHKGKEKATEDPKKWTVENVVDWLKSKKFDQNNQDIYEKFIGACR